MKDYSDDLRWARMMDLLNDTEQVGSILAAVSERLLATGDGEAAAAIDWLTHRIREIDLLMTKSATGPGIGPSSGDGPFSLDKAKRIAEKVAGVTK